MRSRDFYCSIVHKLDTFLFLNQNPSLRFALGKGTVNTKCVCEYAVFISYLRVFSQFERSALRYLNDRT